MTFRQVHILADKEDILVINQIIQVVKDLYFIPLITTTATKGNICLVSTSDKQIKNYEHIIEYKNKPIEQLKQEIFSYHIKDLQKQYRDKSIKSVISFLLPYLYNPEDDIIKDEIYSWLFAILNIDSKNFNRVIKNVEGHILLNLKIAGYLKRRRHQTVTFLGIDDFYLNSIRKKGFSLTPERIKATKIISNKQKPASNYTQPQIATDWQAIEIANKERKDLITQIKKMNIKQIRTLNKILPNLSE